MVDCYHKPYANGGVITKYDGQGGICGQESAAGFYSCCYDTDICFEDALCLSANINSYYTALCTDPTLQDSACSHACSEQQYEYVGYNDTSNTWACFDGTIFSAASPQQLLQTTLTMYTSTPIATSTSSSGGTSSTTAGSVTSLTSASSTSQSQSHPGSSGSSISSGTAAGIGIGAAVGVIFLATLVGFFLMRRSRRRTRNDRFTPNHGLEGRTEKGVAAFPRKAELDDRDMVGELEPTNHLRHEMES